MVKKSRKPFKGFGDAPQNSKQWLAELQHQRLDELEQDLMQSSLASQIGGILRNPEGEVKMSEVLKAFVQPYLKFVKNRDQRMTLFQTGVAAWDLALLPEERRQPTMEEVIETLCPGQSDSVKQGCRSLLSKMIVRKQQLFADNHRYIVNFKLHETEENYQISVMSTLPDRPNATE